MESNLQNQMEKEPKKMDLAEIDTNLAVETTISREGLRFYNVEEEPFRIYGVYKDDGMYRRFPAEEAARVSGSARGEAAMAEMLREILYL